MNRPILLLIVTVALLAGAAAAEGAAPRKSKAEPAVPVSELLDKAEQAIAMFESAQAEELLGKAETALGKARKPDAAAKARLDSLQGINVQLRSMLDRVEQIVIIDSIAVHREDFFKVYRLSMSAGALRSDSQLPRQWDAAQPSTAYLTEDGRTVIYAAPDSTENFRLMEASLLSDGKWDTPLPLDDSLGEGGDANYPWLMSDGITLYYANDGENSLGGYDIFITRRNSDGGFYQPQNMGLPYNSRYDDYLLAIDEESGTGWWATDRNQLGDSITVYRFVVSDLRRNYPADMPGLASRARLDNWRATQEPGVDYSSYLSMPSAESRAERKPDFELALPDGRVLTQYDQLPGEEARELMQERVSLQNQLATDRRRLEVMRNNWRPGNDGDDIMSLEADIRATRLRIKELTNRVIRLM